jgi:hypothetical protein
VTALFFRAYMWQEGVKATTNGPTVDLELPKLTRRKNAFEDLRPLTPLIWILAMIILWALGYLII